MKIRALAVVGFALVASCGGPSSKGFQVTVSGEDLAQVGYDFAAGAKANGDPPAFVEGWAVKFTHVIVTLDQVTLSEDPDKDPTDATVTGPIVATLAGGPFAVDVSIGGTIPGKSGSPDEKTVAVGTLDAKSDGASFDPAKRYAFGYKTVPASASAKQVNLDAEGKTLYAEAVTNGWAMIFVGEANYKGPLPTGDFAKIPSKVSFKLGFKNSSSYINCENTDLQETGGAFPRGVQAKETEQVTVQITLHTDHAFWSKLNVEGTELHFDPIAANGSTYGTATSPGTVAIVDLDAVDFHAFKAKGGTDVLNARSNVPDFTAPAGQLSFDPNGTTFTKANSFASYLSYAAASGMHMNADGECEIRNDFTP